MFEADAVAPRSRERKADSSLDFIRGSGGKLCNERRKAIANLHRRLPKLEFAVTSIFVAHAGAIVAECARGNCFSRHGTCGGFSRVSCW